MGANGSSLVGKASVHRRLAPFTTWGKEEVFSMRTRHFHDLGGRFALSVRQFASLLDMTDDDARDIFHGLFDTDKNLLVDALEVIGAFAMLSTMTISEKMDFIHSLYDFNSSGEITIDEMTIMIRTLVAGCGKMDKGVDVPTIQRIEELTAWAFRKADKDMDGEIAKYEFDAFCLTNPTVKSFLEYWSGAANQVVLRSGKAWVDPAFRPAASSLYSNVLNPPAGMMPGSMVSWLRPAQFCPGSPKLYSAGSAGPPGVLKRGHFANSWFLNAVALVSVYPNLLKTLFVNTGQEDQGRYCIRFFKSERWVSVAVDDFVPCDPLGRPIVASTHDPNEIWACLLEKAYAKLHGSYEALVDGDITYALRDLTSGSVERFDLTAKEWQPNGSFNGSFNGSGGAAPSSNSVSGSDGGDGGDDGESKTATATATEGGSGVERSVSVGMDGRAVLWSKLGKCMRDGVMVGGMWTIPNDTAAGDKGTFKGVNQNTMHAVIKVADCKHGVKLVKMRNPWGGTSYTGHWGPESSLWSTAPPDVLDATDNNARAHGVFWMAFEDFVEIFDMLFITELHGHGGPGAANASQSTTTSKGGPGADKSSGASVGGATAVSGLSANGSAAGDAGGVVGDPDGAWTHQFRQGEFPGLGGGSPNHKSWVDNPQFYLEVLERTTLDISLTQRDPRYHGVQVIPQPMGILVQKHDWGADVTIVKPLVRLEQSDLMAQSTPFKPVRETSMRLRLDVGKYVIIPMRFDPQGPMGDGETKDDLQFWLSVFSKSPLHPVKLYSAPEIELEDPSLMVEEGITELEAEATLSMEVQPNDPEPPNETVALAALSDIVSELWRLARDLQYRKEALHDTILDLEAAVKGVA